MFNLYSITDEETRADYFEIIRLVDLMYRRDLKKKQDKALK